MERSNVRQGPRCAEKHLSDDPTARILDLLARLETGQAGLAERLDRTRIELMARMDRLQDALAVQRDE